MVSEWLYIFRWTIMWIQNIRLNWNSLYWSICRSEMYWISVIQIHLYRHFFVLVTFVFKKFIVYSKWCTTLFQFLYVTNNEKYFQINTVAINYYQFLMLTVYIYYNNCIYSSNRDLFKELLLHDKIQVTLLSNQ